MDVLDFARRISMIDKPTPISDSFDNEWGQVRNRWWTSQREHLTVWCLFQPTNGVKGYKHRPNNSAEIMYNNFGRPETLLWLAEAVGIEGKLLYTVVDEITKHSHASTQCKILRERIPFEAISINLPKILE
ncbi:hypothetical protein RZO27_03765 [Lactococcus lactis]|uniref:Uncharacterized protein n=1 Tax=Lactococcus lactis TaxID=1358 RepID=A0ABD5GM00_9LACT|nr:hypothetical protein [Lactococcus lactis]MDV2618248.1 hypothetical protein [Lactococcus lactis]